MKTSIEHNTILVGINVNIGDWMLKFKIAFSSYTYSVQEYVTILWLMEWLGYLMIGIIQDKLLNSLLRLQIYKI